MGLSLLLLTKPMDDALKINCWPTHNTSTSKNFIEAQRNQNSLTAVMTIICRPDQEIRVIDPPYRGLLSSLPERTDEGYGNNQTCRALPRVIVDAVSPFPLIQHPERCLPVSSSLQEPFHDDARTALAMQLPTSSIQYQEYPY